ncbi:cobalamin biosynthesis protein [Marichromatium bheemlicum]|uniref:Cobalamin biosynthesis protein n=1 Tax=Marichromatium bheemlicum TaxID=365339 RepID=A0ABX1IAK8_9GAMM|nr:cobalamin biosynthesis protein [Marichromatium bheemlicum]NKN34308.1 cobalamin biosynthesis protein [Marichromatium bheemlicum]
MAESGRAITIGVGFQRGVARASLESAIDAALGPLGAIEVRALASLEHKCAEPALRALAAARGWPLLGLAAAQLAEIEVPNGSARVANAVATPSVAEAAALYAAGGTRLLLPRQIYRDPASKAITLAIAASTD